MFLLAQQLCVCLCVYLCAHVCERVCVCLCAWGLILFNGLARLQAFALSALVIRAP